MEDWRPTPGNPAAKYHQLLPVLFFTFKPPCSKGRLTKRFERGSQFCAEKFGLFPRREVAAFVHLVEVDQIPVGPPCPRLRGSIDVIREHRDGDRKRDLPGSLRGRN